jgi:hypothetical protein
MQDFATAIKLDPQNSEAYLRRGVAKMYLDDHAGGCADLSRAISLGSKEAVDAQKHYCK